MTLNLESIRETHHVYVAPFSYKDSEISLREGVGLRGVFLWWN